jgi:Phasin protein
MLDRPMRGARAAPPPSAARQIGEAEMAKAQAEEMRVKGRDMQMTAAFDPSQALSGIEPLLNASNKWFENWVAMQSELLEFSRNRLDRNLEISKAIARCGSIDETMDLHADYTRSTVRDYFTEAGKLADLGTRAMLETLSMWQPMLREAQQRRSAAA